MPKKSPPPDVGNYDRIVTWQRLATGQARDEYQQPIRAARYLDVCDLWISLRPMGGREAANADRLKAVGTFELECLFPGPMAATDRFRYLDPATSTYRYFNFINVNNVDEHGMYCVIQANETTNPAEDQT
jgi:head-tail adaptor